MKLRILSIKRHIMSTSGWLYCFQNAAMPGMYKIGMTTRALEIRLKEANTHDTYKPPHLYTVAFAREVDNVRNREKEIHKLLEERGKRVNPKREFFDESLEKIKELFDAIPGTDWVEGAALASKKSKGVIEDRGAEDIDFIDDSGVNSRMSGVAENNFIDDKSVIEGELIDDSDDFIDDAIHHINYLRLADRVIITNVLKDMANEEIEVCKHIVGDSYKCLLARRADSLDKKCENGELITHTIKNEPGYETKHIWKGRYVANTNEIKRHGKYYKSFAAFATAHYQYVRGS